MPRYEVLTTETVTRIYLIDADTRSDAETAVGQYSSRELLEEQLEGTEEIVMVREVRP